LDLSPESSFDVPFDILTDSKLGRATNSLIRLPMLRAEQPCHGRRRRNHARYKNPRPTTICRNVTRARGSPLLAGGNALASLCLVERQQRAKREREQDEARSQLATAERFLPFGHGRKLRHHERRAEHRHGRVPSRVTRTLSARGRVTLRVGRGWPGYGSKLRGRCAMACGGVGIGRSGYWRLGAESNRCTRLCRPLHHHSAT
jgi:hypothetical protein